MLRLTCNQCGKTAYTDDGLDPDSALACECCPEDHNHGHAANESGKACRPITITVMGPIQVA